jgi:hypothetical protein
MTFPIVSQFASEAGLFCFRLHVVARPVDQGSGEQNWSMFSYRQSLPSGGPHKAGLWLKTNSDYL